METFTLILRGSLTRGTRAGELSFQKLFECSQFGGNRFNRFKLTRKSVGGLEAIAGNAEYSSFIGTNAPLRVQFARGGHGNAASSFSENAFGFSQQSHGLHDFRITGVFSPAAAAQNHLRGVEPIGGVAYWKGDRARFAVCGLHLL